MENAQNKILRPEGLLIQSTLDPSRNVYEITMNSTPLGVYTNETDAREAVGLIHEAYERGFKNGLLQAFSDEKEARHQLESRGVVFDKVIDFNHPDLQDNQ